jgi:hypothetical protein
MSRVAADVPDVEGGAVVVGWSGAVVMGDGAGDGAELAGVDIDPGNADTRLLGSLVRLRRK